MSLAKQKWTDAEERALRDGVGKYGSGKWRAIQRDQQLGPVLGQRSNVDLKDKWRNMALALPLSPGSPDSARGSSRGSREKATRRRSRADSGADASAGGGESEDEAAHMQRYEAMIVEALHRLGAAQAWTAEAILQCMQEHDSLSATSRREAFLFLRMMCSSGGIEKLETETRPYLYRLPVGSRQGPGALKRGPVQALPQRKAHSSAELNQLQESSDSHCSQGPGDPRGNELADEDAPLSFATRRVRGKRGGSRPGEHKGPGDEPRLWGAREQASVTMQEACAALKVAKALEAEAEELEEKAQQAELDLAQAIAAAHESRVSGSSALSKPD